MHLNMQRLTNLAVCQAFRETDSLLGIKKSEAHNYRFYTNHNTAVYHQFVCFKVPFTNIAKPINV